MSSEKIRFESVRDPRTDLQSAYALEVRDGPANVSYVTVAAGSQQTFGTQSFVFNPAPNEGIGRYCTVRIKGTTTITFKAGKAPDADHVGMAFRAWPLMSAMQAIQVTVNSTTLTMPQPNIVAVPWSRIANPAYNQTGAQSTSATAPDWMSSNIDAPVADVGSPFAVRNARGEGVYAPRTFGFEKITLNDQVVTIDFDVTEPLTCSPFQADADNKTALYGIGGNFRVQYTMSVDSFNRALSLAILTKGYAGLEVESMTTTLENQEVQAQFFTPTNDSFLRRLPNQWYSAPQYSVQSFAFTSANGSDSVININSFSLGVVPRLLVIWAAQNYDTGLKGSQLANACGVINKVQLSFLNKQNLLASATQQQLYELSTLAGLQATYSEFAGLPYLNGQVAAGNGDTVPVAYGCGCPVVIDTSILSLPDDVAPGTVMSTLIGGKVTVNVDNIRGATAGHDANADNIPMTLYVMAVLPGYLQLGSGGSSYVEGGLTGADVATARKADSFRTAVFEKMALTGTLSGGSFFSDFAKGFRSVVEPGLQIVSKLAGAGGASMNATGARSLRERLMHA